jgi:hypothetical protein
MKNLLPLTSILAFICTFLFSCDKDLQKPNYTYPNPGVETKIDFSGTWVATRITHIYGDEAMDVSGSIPEIRICVNENHSLCIINGSDSWFSTAKWGDYPDTYFSNQVNQCSIKIRIIESNHNEITAQIKNLTPYLFSLCLEEKEDGYYLATFRRYDGLY